VSEEQYILIILLLWLIMAEVTDSPITKVIAFAMCSIIVLLWFMKGYYDRKLKRLKAERKKIIDGGAE